MFKKIISSVLVLVLAAALCACGTPDGPNTDASLSVSGAPVDKPTVAPSPYEDAALWAFCENERTETVDTFFVAPTAVSGAFYNLLLDNTEQIEKMKLQIGNQKGIYDDCTRFFSPVYRQMTLPCYALSDAERAPYFDLAYGDVKDAFSYYLANFNNGNKIILAGNSQGAEMLMHLLKDFFGDSALADRLICCYAIGWKVTQEDMDALPLISFAQSATDLKTVVSFNSELPEVDASLIVEKDEKTLCINPLSWSTSTEPAAASLNLGCCIYSTKGYQKGDDMVGFCGAYIDSVRGTLKLTGMEQQDPDGTLYPSRIDGQPYGVFHIYDWEFFYRNLESNVKARVAAADGQ